MSDAPHVPVLLDEVVSWLAPKPDGIYVDCTSGFGGHTDAIRERMNGRGRIIAMDCDPSAYGYCIKRFEAYKNVVKCYNINFIKIREALKSEGLDGADGILVDCGVSSAQIDEPERGFSFRHAGPLDMRMDPRLTRTAETALRDLSEEELADVIYQYGEERKSRRIARAVKEAWRTGGVKDTAQLAEVVKRSLPRGYEHGRIHPATRTFQALRIWVNDELGRLEKFLSEATVLLRPGGRLAAISFHSLEDRMIKHTFRKIQTEGGYKVLTRKPVEPADAERERNVRSRSAKLRVLERELLS